MEQLALAGILDDAPPPRRHAKPILKYAGGKTWLVPYVCPGIYRRLGRTGGRYVEPFLGGGAVALDLGLPSMILGDAVPDLIDLYDAVRKQPTAVAWALSTLAAKGLDEESYYHVRDSRPTAPVMIAARTIYLNRMGYNGCFRVNKKGEFNVPYGHHEKYRKSIVGRSVSDAIDALFPSGGKLQAVAEAFKTADLECWDFAQTIARSRKGDVIFADPPYAGTFDAYTADGFSPEDQRQLAEHLRDAADRGIDIISTNADCEEIRDLYSWATIISSAEARLISQDTTTRKRAQTLIITTDQNLLGT